MCLKSIYCHQNNLKHSLPNLTPPLFSFHKSQNLTSKILSFMQHYIHSLCIIFEKLKTFLLQNIKQELVRRFPEECKGIFIQNNTNFDKNKIRAWFIFWKCCHKNVSFCNLMLGANQVAQQIFPAHRAMYFLQLLNTNLLSETIVSQVQLAFICLNSAIAQ